MSSTHCYNDSTKCTLLWRPPVLKPVRLGLHLQKEQRHRRCRLWPKLISKNKTHRNHSLGPSRWRLRRYRAGKKKTHPNHSKKEHHNQSVSLGNHHRSIRRTVIRLKTQFKKRKPPTVATRRTSNVLGMIFCVFVHFSRRDLWTNFVIWTPCSGTLSLLDQNASLYNTRDGTNFSECLVRSEVPSGVSSQHILGKGANKQQS